MTDDELMEGLIVLIENAVEAKGLDVAPFARKVRDNLRGEITAQMNRRNDWLNRLEALPLDKNHPVAEQA